MGLAAAVIGSATIGTSEYYILSASTTKVDQTDTCILYAHIDFTNLVAGDRFQVKLYEKINGTQRNTVLYTPDGVSDPLILGPIHVSEGWELSLKKLAGTDRAIAYSTRKVDKVTADAVDVTKWNGTAVATPTTAGVPRVDVKAMEANVVTAAAIADAAIDLATIAADLQGAFFVRRNTATAGGASTITLDASASAVDSFYKNTRIYIVSGTGVGQTRGYSSYVGSTKVYTVDSAWSTNPDNTSVFMIIGNLSGTGATAADIADAVWDEATSGHVTAGTFGKLDQDISGYLDTEVAAIKAKTDNLPSDPADASDIAASFSSIASTLSTIAGYVDTEVATLVTNVAAVKAKTDNLPSDPADASDIAASLTSLGSDVTAVKAKTDNLPADPADASDIAALVDALPTAGEIVDALMDFSHDTGVTMLGLFRRLEATISGKATGLRSTVARFFMRDGTTPATQATQDTDAGTRVVADVSGSEP